MRQEQGGGEDKREGERQKAPEGEQSSDTQTLESGLPLHPGLAFGSCVALAMLFKLSVLQCPDLKMEVIKVRTTSGPL